MAGKILFLGRSLRKTRISQDGSRQETFHDKCSQSLEVRGIKYLNMFLQVDFAIMERCKRLDFHVLNWNPAKKFYEALGATNLSEKEGWEFFRLTQSEMEGLVANIR